MQSLPRYSISFIVGVFLLSLQGQAFAVDYFLKNDGMGENFEGTTATAELISGEMYAATFELPSSWQLPVELQGVRVLMVDGSEPSKTYCGRFTIEVWEEAAGAPTNPGTCPFTRVKDPGPVVYSMSNQFQSNPIGFELVGNNNNWQDMRFSAINNNAQLGVTINPVMLDTRRVRVAIKAIDNQCFNVSNANAFPVLVTDDDGTSADNFLYGEADLCGSISGTVPPPEFYYWTDFAQYFQATPGDFIMRLIFDRPGPGGGDVGVDAGADAGPDVGMDAGMDVGSDIGSSDIGLDAKPADVSGGEDVAQQDTSSGQQDTGAELSITSVSPSTITNDQSTNIAIVGSGFVAGAQVLIGAEAVGVTETQSGIIKATVPEGFALGMHDVIVTNPGGATAVLEDGLEVTEPGAADADAGAGADTDSVGQSNNGSGAAAEGCGCRSVDTAAATSTWAWVLAALALLGVMLRRRLVPARRRR
jgi:MYXO-CTERM domain-containing protein